MSAGVSGCCGTLLAPCGSIRWRGPLAFPGLHAKISFHDDTNFLFGETFSRSADFPMLVFEKRDSRLRSCQHSATSYDDARVASAFFGRGALFTALHARTAVARHAKVYIPACHRGR